MSAAGTFLCLAIFRTRLAPKALSVPAKRQSPVTFAPFLLTWIVLPSVLATAVVLGGEGVLGRFGGRGAAEPSS